MVADDQPSLGQLIWLVRRELEWAHQIDVDHPLKFDVDSVELDVVVEVTKSTTGGGGLDLTVPLIGIGVKGDLARESARASGTTVHIVLTPVAGATGAKFQVSALDTEPPPRRASTDPADTGAGNPGSLAAADTEG